MAEAAKIAMMLAQQVGGMPPMSLGLTAPVGLAAPATPGGLAVVPGAQPLAAGNAWTPPSATPREVVVTRDQLAPCSLWPAAHVIGAAGGAAAAAAAGTRVYVGSISFEVTAESLKVWTAATTATSPFRTAYLMTTKPTTSTCLSPLAKCCPVRSCRRQRSPQVDHTEATDSLPTRCTPQGAHSDLCRRGQPWTHITACTHPHTCHLHSDCKVSHRRHSAHGWLRAVGQELEGGTGNAERGNCSCNWRGE